MTSPSAPNDYDAQRAARIAENARRMQDVLGESVSVRRAWALDGPRLGGVGGPGIRARGMACGERG